MRDKDCSLKHQFRRRKKVTVNGLPKYYLSENKLKQTIIFTDVPSSTDM